MGCQKAIQFWVVALLLDTGFDWMEVHGHDGAEVSI